MKTVTTKKYVVLFLKEEEVEVYVFIGSRFLAHVVPISLIKKHYLLFKYFFFETFIPFDFISIVKFGFVSIYFSLFSFRFLLTCWCIRICVPVVNVSPYFCALLFFFPFFVSLSLFEVCFDS